MKYVVNTDGGSRGNPGAAGWGFVVRRDGAVVLERAGFLEKATNNVAEYLAVVTALEEISAADPSAEVTVRADSKLVVEQLSGRWKIKSADLRPYAARASRALPGRVTYQWVPRAENAAADKLANEAMDTRGPITRGSLLDGVDEPAVPEEAEGSDGAEALEPAVRPSGAANYEGSHEPVTLIFVRHGATTLTESRGYSGGSVPGPPLSDLGLAQASRVAALLTRAGELWPDLPAPSLLLASPMVRTQQTAEAIGEALGLEPKTVPELREADFGLWEGLTREEIRERFPGDLEKYHTDPDARATGGESTRDVAERVASVVRRALTHHAGQTIVLACHSVVTKAGVASLVGIPEASWQNVRVPPASISIVRLWPDAAELVTAGLPSELAGE